MSAVFNFTFVPWFRSVAPYIHMHRGKTFVVGVAGEAIAAGKLRRRAVAPLASLLFGAISEAGMVAARASDADADALHRELSALLNALVAR